MRYNYQIMYTKHDVYNSICVLDDINKSEINKCKFTKKLP